MLVLPIKKKWFGELLPVSEIAEIEGISYQNAYDKYVRHTKK